MFIDLHSGISESNFTYMQRFLLLLLFRILSILTVFWIAISCGVRWVKAHSLPQVLGLHAVEAHVDVALLGNMVVAS